MRAHNDTRGPPRCGREASEGEANSVTVLFRRNPRGSAAKRSPAGRAETWRASMRFLISVAVLISAAPLGGGQPAREKIAPSIFARTAFLGDSITDGNTYPCLVCDALNDAGIGKMTVINAGIGGDTVHGMRLRLERDVLVFRPTLVTLSAGANDT